MDRLNKSTSANCADKRKKQSSRLRLRWIFLLLMAHTLAWAQDLDYPGEDYVRNLDEWNGEGSGEFKITSNKTANSIKVVNELKLYPVDDSYTITKTSTGHDNIFWTEDGSKLYIIGNSSYKLNIYGNCGNGTTENQTPIPTQTDCSGAGVLLLGNAKCYLKHVVFYGFVTHVGPEGKLTNQGGIVTMGNNSSGGECHMDHVTFRHSYGGPVNPQNRFNYGRIISFVNGVWDVTMDNVTIHDCLLSENTAGHNYTDVKIEGMGSIIRSQGQVGGSLTMTNCTAYNNTYRDLSAKSNITYYQSMDEIKREPLSGQGGVINWRSGRLSPSGGTQVTLENCNFYNNSARCGGAIATCATITMKNTQIHENEAEEGGGVFFYTYRGQDNPYDGRGFDATFGNNVKVYQNVAKKYGGGICINIDASDDVGFDADGNARYADFTVEIQTNSEVYGNKAPKGAGIAIRDSAPFKHKNCKKKLLGGNDAPDNPAYHKWSGEYRREVKINGGSVYNNTTDGTTADDEMAGAGIFIEKYPTTFEFTYSDGGDSPVAYSQDYRYENEPGTYVYVSGTLTVNAENGLIYGNIATNDNKHGYGGGMYIASKFTTYDNDNTIKSTLNVNIGKEGKDLQMYQNQAYTDGGGVYVLYDREDGHQNEGTVTVKGGTIGKTNLATGNKALHGNGGGICVMSGTVVVENGHVDYNTANQKGGGIYLNDGNLTFTGGNVDQNEASNSNGGGICVMGGTVEVDGGHVDHNTANQKGGGIYLNGGDLTFTGGYVDQNEASNSDGGGICVEGGNIVVSGGTVSNNEAKLKNGGGICVLGGTVFVNGGNILDNTAAELGGGVYVSVPNNNSKTTIQGGANISENTAKGGGGVYVDKGKLDIIGNRWNPAANSGAGAWELVGWGTNPYNPGEESTHTRITHNTATAGNGGGVNAGNGKVDITNSLIYWNEAFGSVGKGLGGGVYLDGGFIKIYNSKILNNTAETNGGGIDDHSGDIEIYGGDISHNTATNGRGGGVYTNAGDIRIWPSALYNNPVPAPSLNDCKNTGTVFSHNKAGTNGGGLNTHIGRLDVRFANVHDNEAGTTFNPSTGAGGGNGGGMFCEGPNADLSGYTVRLLHTYLDYNKAFGNSDEESNLTGRGGGLYLKYGSIFAEHCYVRNNEADINGGGLDNHDGELRVYGTFVEDNEAKNGKGGGLYTDKGNLVVGPCDSYGFDESKASRICNNTAYLNGGGINNHEGNITIHGDRINNNTATTGKGGGVYINSGNIYMYGGQINNNHADDPSGGYGGGVYGGGGTFKIMEREAHPILEILEIESISTDGFTVHFHHVDRGYAMKPTASDKEYGIAFSENPYPSDLGENVEWTEDTGTSTDWTGVTKVYFNPTSSQPTPGEPLYNQNEGCSRFVVNNSTTPNGITINSNTTYYVVAYGKYTYGGKNYFDASPAVKVTTYGTMPVVVTGVAFDVTATSASVNAKQFYAGSTALTARGIEISSDGGGSWTAHPSSSVGDVFSVVVTGLSPNATYKARAYATNSSDTGYGSEIEFTTASSGGGKAAEGNYPKSIYPSVEENPFFMELTPLQQAILASTPEVDTTKQHHSPAAKDDPTPNVDGPVDIPEINYNTATYGGGVCIDKQGAELIFAGTRNSNAIEMGQINNNYASEAGGGIYIGKESAERYAKMQMMGKCEVNFNHVPANKQGGGIYLDGRLYVGDKDTDAIGTHGLKVDQNYAVNGNGAGLPSSYVSEGRLNNVFLTRYNYEYNANADETGDNNVSVITLLSDISGYSDQTNNVPYSHIGFSVLKGFCPVIATSDCFTKVVQGQTVDGNYNLHNYTPSGASAAVSSETWLYNLMVMAGGESGTAETMRGAVFEDSESYVAIHTRIDNAPFREKFIYLWGCWTHPVVKEDPEKRNPMSMRGYGVDFDGHYKIKNHEKYTTDNVGNATGTEALEWEIYSPEGLAWFSAYVNGLNVFDEKEGGITGYDSENQPIYDPNHYKWKKEQNPKAKAVIMNDLDMSAYLWVPIGSVKKFYKTGISGGSLFVDSEDEPTLGGYTDQAHYYSGSFDGQGHIITGLQGLYLTGIRKYGLFGYLAEGAEVKNTFVDEGMFVSDNKGVVYSAGGIAGEMKEGSVVSNSEARMSFDGGYSGAGTALGGLVGDVKGGSIHSSMAMPSFTGHDKGQAGENPTYNAFDGFMGGLAGRLGSGCDLKNSFANSEIVLTTEGTGSTATRYLGGLVGENHGTVENCYVRYHGTTRPSGFGWAAGSNLGTITVCFAPEGKVGGGDGQSWYTSGDNSVTLRRTYGETSLVSGKYGFAHQDQQVSAYGGDNADYIKNGPMDADGLNGLLASLNNWVNAKNTTTNTYSTWTRTMASPINDDYPVIQIAGFNSVGSKDGIYMMYEDNINDMWAESGKDFQACNTAGSNAAMYLYDAQPETVTITNNDNVRLYIHEDVGITQSQNSVLHARVGVTIKNTRKGANDYTDDPNWHLFSSAINEVPIGLDYHTSEEANYMNSIVNGGPHADGVWGDRNQFDPPMTTWFQSDNAQAASYNPNQIGYFPTDTPYGTWRPGTNDGQSAATVGGFFDLFDYSEEYYHWMNYKREGTDAIQDHWHYDKDAQDKNHYKISGYRNDVTMLAGKGYLMALSGESMMMADGTLNTGGISHTVTKTAVGSNLPPHGHGSYAYDEPYRSLNIAGNPYQSYLDFYKFVFNTEANNRSLLFSDNGTTYSYATRSADGKTYEYFTITQSENPETAGPYLHPHQGFFVKVTGNGDLNFNDNMRVAGTSTSLNSPYRDRLNYPLVNLFCYDANGKRDYTTVEISRPEAGGGHKMENLCMSDAQIYAHYNDDNYQILFAPEGVNVVPVRCKVIEDGYFTMRWSTYHGDFSYLHLIDNLTGADVDCLTTDEYKFEGKASDYNSRFKLVFDCTGIDEPEAPEPDEGPTVFAFQMGDELIVNGEGVLQMFDLNGRCLMTRQAVGQQSSVSLPQVAAGMYLLRLTSNKQVRVQKMVIK